MPQDINLLPEQDVENKSQIKQRRLINTLSGVILGLTILTVVGLFIGDKIIIRGQLDALAKDMTVQSGRIEARKTQEGIYRSLAAKITRLDTFFTAQKHYSNFLKELSATFPQSMRLTDLTIDLTQNVTVTGSAASYADLSGFFAKLGQAGPKVATGSARPYFIAPLLTSISRNEQSGDISFALKFSLSPQVLKRPQVAGAP